MTFDELSKAIEESKEGLTVNEGVQLAAQILFPHAAEEGFKAEISSKNLKTKKRCRLDVLTRR